MVKKEELNFEDFLAEYGFALDEYLSRVAIACDSGEEQESTMPQVEAIFAVYPTVEQVVDRYEPCALSLEESEALIRLLVLRDEEACQEMRRVYYKGCADCAGYLKRLGLL